MQGPVEHGDLQRLVETVRASGDHWSPTDTGRDCRDRWRLQKLVEIVETSGDHWSPIDTGRDCRDHWRSLETYRDWQDHWQTLETIGDLQTLIRIFYLVTILTIRGWANSCPDTVCTKIDYGKWSIQAKRRQRLWKACFSQQFLLALCLVVIEHKWQLA